MTDTEKMGNLEHESKIFCVKHVNMNIKAFFLVLEGNWEAICRLSSETEACKSMDLSLLDKKSFQVKLARLNFRKTTSKSLI